MACRKFQTSSYDQENQTLNKTLVEKIQLRMSDPTLMLPRSLHPLCVACYLPNVLTGARIQIPVGNIQYLYQPLHCFIVLFKQDINSGISILLNYVISYALSYCSKLPVSVLSSQCEYM